MGSRTFSPPTRGFFTYLLASPARRYGALYIFVLTYIYIYEDIMHRNLTLRNEGAKRTPRGGRSHVRRAKNT